MSIARVYFKAANEFTLTFYIHFRRRIRWAGHVARMGRREVICCCSVEPEGSRPLG
jgi:hypothetical protein